LGWNDVPVGNCWRKTRVGVAATAGKLRERTMIEILDREPASTYIVDGTVTGRHDPGFAHREGSDTDNDTSNSHDRNTDNRVLCESCVGITAHEQGRELSRV
jgi:hypothetical protein